MQIERVNILGVGISAIHMGQALEVVEAALRTRTKGYVAVTGVHGVSVAQDDPEFRTILNRALLCTPDGMPMVWLGKLAGHKHMSRVYGPDLMLEVCRLTQRTGHTHYFFGGDEGVVQELKATLEKNFPGLKVVGTMTPPFRPLNEGERASFIKEIGDLKPDILWVGLSTPKQEQFMATFLPQLETTLMFGVGAAFNFHTGRVRQAPRWMQQSGLEWFYRVCQEPRRLWWRYLRNNTLFVARVMASCLGLRKRTEL